MSAVEHIHIGAMDPRRFSSVLTPDEYRSLLALIEAGNARLGGRVIWNVNSTAHGGGVAELLASLLGYARGAGIDARWVVVGGNSRFFSVTKRLHNHLHGFNGDRYLDAADRAVYERTLARVGAELIPMIRSGDVVILHDPQTAGLARAVRETGATVIWRCHVGIDDPNDLARDAWGFLRDYVTPAHAYVFSRASFAWEGLDLERIAVIQPSIDAFSPKNQALGPDVVRAILVRAGLLSGVEPADPTFVRGDGTPGRVDRRAELLEEAPLDPAEPLVLQVSRWDRLKDPLGVMRGFARHIAPYSRAHLMLAGPATAAVSDDPEGAAIFRSVCDAWRDLAPELRARVHLASLPMNDGEENAAIVNALQCHATVVVQKSLAEGFGLTVAEAMWKGRPVVGSRVGGIQDQIVDGASGLLISDPTDLAAFGGIVRGLLDDPERADRIGQGGRERVRRQFLGPYHLQHYFDLIARLLDQREALVGVAARR